MKQNPEETDRVCCGAVEKDLQDDIAQLTAESDAMSERLKQLQHKVTMSQGDYGDCCVPLVMVALNVCL